MLADSQIAAFRKQGYLIVENVLDSQTLAAVRDEYDALLSRLIARYHAAGRIDSPRQNGDFDSRFSDLICAAPDAYQHLDISLPLADNLSALADQWREILGDDENAGIHAGPAVFGILSHPRVLDIAESLLGGEILCNPTQHARIKPPQHLLPPVAVGDANVSRTLWHQDEAVLHESARDSDVLTVWAAITHADEKNGCMQCVAGSHKDKGGGDLGLALHCPGRELLGEIYIPDAVIPRERLVSLQVGAGGIVLLNRRTVHGAGANRSSKLRWSFDLRYQRMGELTGRDFFPSFVARSRANPAAELHDAASYRQNWLDARDGIIGGEVEAVFNTRWNKNATAPLCA